ncbi:hypothetical protein M3223_04065 [Paenibacillus pasadenensis]|uniref:hypothetical protein n=1 Tax=Paenibacillus pasadenensis TaxID=217090 RepID=UPI002040188A|nr:hypothetical protein [Paenibacillus pasadenensis]MCM3746524.1 hypothetical protein [Paenibacillus pasadenensis]
MAKKYANKSVSFDPNNERDQKLFKELKRLDHGEFTEETKKFWYTRLFGGAERDSKNAE